MVPSEGLEPSPLKSRDQALNLACLPIPPRRLVRGAGVEPAYTASKAAVLPLDEPRLGRRSKPTPAVYAQARKAEAPSCLTPQTFAPIPKSGATLKGPALSFFYVGAPGEIRTRTVRCLGPLTLPIGLQELVGLPSGYSSLSLLGFKRCH